MAANLTRLLQQLRRLSAPAERTADADLLGRFARDHDEEAFACLVARHGPMVLHVCRRLLADAQEAEDAFQATFLVLARKAGAMRHPGALAGWLYGVAQRVALKARSAGRRGGRPQGLDDAPEPADPRPDPLAELSARDLLAVLEQEVGRLPEVYRLPVVLCVLEGLSQEEAARRLGWTAGSLKGRLERGRKRLHERLAGRGVTLSAALGVAEVARGGSSLPAELIAPTIRAAVAFTAGALPAGGVSPNVMTLAQGGLQAMSMSKWKLALAGLVLVGLVGTGIGRLGTGPEKAGPAITAAGDAPKRRAGEVGGDDRQAEKKRAELLDKARAELRRLADESEKLDRELTDKVVEARQLLVELDEMLRDAEEEAQRARVPSAEETNLQAEFERADRALPDYQGWKAEFRKKYEDQAKNAFEKWQAVKSRREKVRAMKTQALIDLRQKKVRLEEDIRLLERRRDTRREEAERRRRDAADRLRQLEREGAGPEETDRLGRAVEKKLDAIQRELSELRREVQRFRPDRK